jgi:hypothetical protein
MALPQNGVDRAVISLWLGHQCVETNQIYMHSDMRLKETPVWSRLARESGSARHNTWIGIMCQLVKDDGIIAFGW